MNAYGFRWRQGGPREGTQRTLRQAAHVGHETKERKQLQGLAVYLPQEGQQRVTTGGDRVVCGVVSGCSGLTGNLAANMRRAPCNGRW